jgi:hypothetical protein
LEDRLPDEHRPDQRHDAKDRAEQKIPPIDEGILDPDIEELPVFLAALGKGMGVAVHAAKLVGRGKRTMLKLRMGHWWHWSLMRYEPFNE